MTGRPEITIPLDEPYFEGAGPELDDHSMPVSLDGRGFLLDLENPTYGWQFSRRSVQLLNTQQSQSGLDQSVTQPEVWRRPIESWHMGADQNRLDRDDSLPFRYHASEGIDPWEKFGISLLHDVTPLATFPAGETCHLEAAGNRLLSVHNLTATVYLSVGTAGTAHTLPAAVVDTTCDGESFYVLCADGQVMKCDKAGTWTSYVTIAAFDATAGMLAYVKGVLLAANGPALLDVTGGTVVNVGNPHRLAGWKWRSASEGLSVIYVLGGMGDRWHIHRVSIAKDGTTLDAPIVAATLPDGEIAYALATYMGYVLVGVNSGWRFGMPDSSGQITYGQLVETAGPVRCFEGQGRFVWFGLTILAGSGSMTRQGRSISNTNAGLGRADLSIFVAPMTPAAASDLEGFVLGETTAVVSVGGEYDGYGRRVFAVTGSVGGGIYVESDTLVPQGWLTTGSMSFNSNDDKMGLYFQVFHETLHGEVILDIADDGNNVFTTKGRNSREGSTSLGNVPYPVAFHAVEQRFTLKRDAVDHTRGPRVTRSEFRAVNIPGRATEWHIPLFVHEDTNYRNTEKARDVTSDYDFLMTLVQSRRQFLYREGERTWRLHAVDFTWMPHHLTSDASTYQGSFLLVAREIT
ncbi:MAG: hypothetical protein ACOYB3_01745 [Azonexus sp.]